MSAVHPPLEPHPALLPLFLGTLALPFRFCIEGFYRVEVGSLYGGQFAHLEQTIFLLGFFHSLLMADRAGAVE